MSFFDETLDTAKKVFSTVEKETVKTASVSKLKVKALRVNAALRDSFAALGKEYYREVKPSGEVPEEFTRLFAEIDRQVAEAEEIKNQIAALQGGTACEGCGTVNSDGAAYCSHCGKELK